MAERHQLKIADHDGIAADDPFAELTRIMGFDPREPVTQQGAAPRQPGTQDASAQDDFDIDLEKELMGEFSAYDDPAEAAPAAHDEPELVAQRQPAQRPDEDHAISGAEEDVDDALVASFEQDFAASEEAGHEVPEFEPEAYAAPQGDVAGNDVSAEEAGDDEVAAALEGTWFSPVDEAAGEEAETPLAPDESATMAAQPHEEDLHDEGHEFDAQVLADLSDELAAADDAAANFDEASDYEPATGYEDVSSERDAVAYEHPDEEPASYEQAAPYAEPLEQEQPQAYSPPAQDPAAGADDFDAHFDDAMADVDMDFVARPQAEPSAVAAWEADEAVSRDEPAFDSDPGIEAAFDEAFAEDIHGDPSAADTSEPVAAPRESTLEDELNTLLAKMTARPTVASAWPIATPVARLPESAPAPQPTNPEPASAAGASEDDLHAALMADLHAMDLDDVPQAGEDMDFDADAFHAALSEDEHAPEAAPADEPAEMPDWSVPAAAAMQPAAARYQPAPDVETVDVPERVVAQADDLEIPDVPFEEPDAGNKLYDDLENEFVGLLGQMDAAPAQVHDAYDDDAYGAGFQQGSMQPQAGSGVFQQPAASASAAAFHPAAAGLAADGAPDATPAGNDPFAVDEFAYDPDDAVAVAAMADAEAARPQRRGLLIAGIVCAVAVAGGLGAMALSFGGGGGEEAPALVKADNGPIKVKPENPGGTVIPNQDNKVYEAVAKGIQPAAPEQKQLLSSNEDPVDVNAAAPQSRVVDLAGSDEARQAGAKSEDRLEQTAQNDGAASDAPIVTPKKVRTMIVKPDGSLVPREDPAPKVAAAEPADPAPQHVVATGDQTGAVPPAQSAEGGALKPARTSASTPKTAPVAPPRPSDQPVDVVGEVKPDQVASISTTASAAGSWSMQIASQPTAESAQSTYQDLARRYGGVLGGHDVNIVKAEIAGKGTFYRVRVPAGSRDDAIKLCESYKAAGGNCFVAK